MKKDTVVSLKKPVEELDPLTALLRAGAQQLLCEAVVAELGVLRRRRWRPGMAPWGSGRRWGSYIPRRARSGVGYTRRRMS